VPAAQPPGVLRFFKRFFKQIGFRQFIQGDPDNLFFFGFRLNVAGIEKTGQFADGSIPIAVFHIKAALMIKTMSLMLFDVVN